MRPYTRANRVGEQIRRNLSELLTKSVHDPRLETVVISDVEVTADIKLATVHFTVTGGEASKDKALKGFQSAKGFVKRELARQLGLRYMPDLRFFYDASFDQGERIERIIHELKQDDGPDHSTIDK
ncbi:MAG: 30S ribosome-binding factor RbfA [Pseudomonadota bacterium]